MIRIIFGKHLKEKVFSCKSNPSPNRPQGGSRCLSVIQKMDPSSSMTHLHPRNLTANVLEKWWLEDAFPFGIAYFLGANCWISEVSGSFLVFHFVPVQEKDSWKKKTWFTHPWMNQRIHFGIYYWLRLFGSFFTREVPRNLSQSELREVLHLNGIPFPFTVNFRRKGTTNKDSNHFKMVNPSDEGWISLCSPLCVMYFL